MTPISSTPPKKGQGRNTHPGLGSVDGSDSLPCLLEQFDERNVDHHAARQSQRERKQSLVGTVSEKGYCAADTGCQAGAEGEHQGYKKSVSHLEYCFSVGLCKDSASRKLCQIYLVTAEAPLIFCKDSASRKPSQIYLDATEAPPVFCKDRARGRFGFVGSGRGLPICRKVSEFYPFFAGEHRIRSVRCVKNPVVWRSIHYFRQEKITIPGESRVFPIRSFLRRLKISSAVHDEIILEEILFNLLISNVICIFRVEVDDIFRKKMVRMV